MKILLLPLCLLFASCGILCDPGSEPSRSGYDDMSRYSGSDGYESITYTYYCQGGKYKSYTYIRKDSCSKYELDSTYESSGICS